MAIKYAVERFMTVEQEIVALNKMDYEEVSLFIDNLVCTPDYS